jgi:heme exporter protein D
MPQESFFDILKQILTSWQVIAVTVVIIIYLHIVSFFARAYRIRRIKKTRARQVFQSAQSAEGPEEVETSSDSNDALGLEEE